jgi:hypothetical protein
VILKDRKETKWSLQLLQFISLTGFQIMVHRTGAKDSIADTLTWIDKAKHPWRMWL